VKVITQGYKYELDNFEETNEQKQVIQFIEKGPKSNENGDASFVTINNGTTNEDVIEVLINRIQYLNNKCSCRENSIAITKLEEALMWLNKRTANRVSRGVEGKQLP